MPTSQPPSTSDRKCRPRYIRDSAINSGQPISSAIRQPRLRMPKHSTSAIIAAVATPT